MKKNQRQLSLAHSLTRSVSESLFRSLARSLTHSGAVFTLFRTAFRANTKGYRL